MNYICKKCGKRFSSFDKRPGRNQFCSLKCRTIGKNYCKSCGIKLSDKRGKNRPKHCLPCSKRTEGWRKGVSKNWFKKGQVSLYKGRVGLREELNPGWKGDNVGYFALHAWLNRKYGRIRQCSLCGENNPNKRYEWSNISGKYKRDINDYIRLCKKCHNNKDGVNAWQNKMKANVATKVAGK